MRIPVPIVLALCLAVVAGTWWHGTRQHDFLTPPPDRKKAEADAAPAAGNPPASLDAHLDLTRSEPGKLSALADAMEDQGDYQQAMLAHERIIDSTQAEPRQLAISMRAIRRLRDHVPPWNPLPDDAMPLTLNVGTSSETADRIAQTIERIADEITKASGGILHVQPAIHRGPNPPVGAMPAPVAIWLTGTNADASTPVLSFTLNAEDEPLPVVTLTVLKILREALSRHSQIRIPIAVATPDDPTGPLFTHVTRLAWMNLGKLVSPPEP